MAAAIVKRRDSELGGMAPAGVVLIISVPSQTLLKAAPDVKGMPPGDMLQPTIWHTGTATATNPTMMIIVRDSLRMFLLASNASPY